MGMISGLGMRKMSSILKKKLIISINENIQKKKTIIGKKNILKNIYNNKMDMIITCNNIPTYLIIQLRIYSRIYGIKLIEFDGDNIEFAIACNLTYRLTV